MQIALDCARQERDGSQDRLLGPVQIQFIGAEVEIIGGEVAGWTAPGAAGLGRLQGRLDDPGDAGRHLILQIEDVFHRAVETVGPEMRAGLRLDQLSGDAHPAGGLQRSLGNLNPPAPGRLGIVGPAGLKQPRMIIRR